ncbi:reverse transcriptase domain-containing protein, partial [Tanacetum coccineum]
MSSGIVLVEAETEGARMGRNRAERQERAEGRERAKSIAEGKDIDVLLEALIDDLKVYGHSKVSSHRRYMALPLHAMKTSSMRVSKTAYVGQRRLLKKPHKLRRSLDFNGETEDKDPLRKFTRAQILTQLDRLPTREKMKHPRVKLPDGFGSNFKHKVIDNDSNITGLKSHDYHIMMQRLLSYGLQQYLPIAVATPIIELCSFSKKICSRTLMESDMMKAQSQVVDILCNLELIYPPTFFDVMIHLVIYLPQEALEGGPIPNSWIPEIDTYRAKFKSEFPNQDVKEEFPSWFESQIRQCYIDTDPGVSASGWSPISVNSCVVNGVRFVVHNRDECRATQNNGICSPDEKEGEMFYGQLKEILEFSCQSMDVDAPSDIIDVDEDYDLIDDEDVLPHDLADSDDEDVTNDDDDDDDVAIVYSNVVRGHGGNDGGDDHPHPHQIFTCRGGQKLNRGGRKSGRLGTRGETRNLELRRITDQWGPQKIRFEFNDKGTLLP